MIGKLTGRVDYVAEDHALIETAGVGYVVHCSPRTLASLPPAGEVAALYTEMLVREDLIQLFGFVTVAEREWHRLLISVQGVGAKVSLAILGALGPEGVGRAIALGDSASVKTAPGVGPKLATRIVNELKDKAPAVMALGARGAKLAEVIDASDTVTELRPVNGRKPAARPAPSAAAQADALSALANLGYAPGEAASAVAEAAGADPDASEQALIKAALKSLARAV
jgi:Holliday junction DNA helicase RuvA